MRVYTHEFFVEQKTDKTSVYNYLKGEGVELSEDKYQELIMWFARKALQNDFDFSDSGDLNMAGVENSKLKQAVNKLSSVKAHSVQAVVTTKQDKSEIRLIVVNSTDYSTIFEVPITESDKVLQEGVINLDDPNNPPFKIFGRPYF